MAAIKDLLRQIADPTLRARLTEEIDRLSKNKKFGLVFEEHIPECTPLYGVPVRRGSTVARKTGKMNEIYTIKNIDGETAVCVKKSTRIAETIPLVELVSVAKFGEPIFPSLEPIAKVTNAPDDALWHTLIEAENYHALQLLEYLYEAQVDCIYIDPPYNTGARDWKYNNDYVDSADVWRHSKWLAMMKKRLLIAKRIMNPENSVLIVTIDEREYNNLGLLLKDMFPEATIQMISTVINPAGVTRTGGFSRTDEYIYFVMMGSAKPQALPLPDEWRGNIKGGYKDKLRWNGLQRSGTGILRSDRPNMFYPVFISEDGKRITEVGNSIPLGINRKQVETPEGSIVVWPIFPDGREGRWRLGRSTLLQLIDKHYVKLGKFRGEATSITYLARGEQLKVESGDFPTIGYADDGSVIVDESAYEAKFVPGTQWWISSHDATQRGTKTLTAIIPNVNFTFPKSPYAVRDAISFFVAENPNALIIDFFAGSGTTLHAVNLLNAEDGGKRRCILVTNNEVSEAETRDLKAAGYQPGDPEWERHGICRSVTWPRTGYSILGKRADGMVLTGEYYTSKTVTKEINRSFYQLGFVENPAALTLSAKKQLVALFGKDKLPQSLVKAYSRFIVSEKHTASVLFDPAAADEWLAALEEQEHITDFYIVAKEGRVFNDIKAKVVDLLGTISVSEPLKRPMREGFPANVEYFKLGFLDKNNVSLGQQFHEILPLLWLKAGAVGERPEIDGEDLPDMMILPQNSFAVLLDEDRYGAFAEALLEAKNIRTVYFVTNSEEAFREMADGIGIERTYQLYRDYIDNFVIGSRRNNQ
jgi:adenine-specific DNA-methyltransferase